MLSRPSFSLIELITVIIVISLLVLLAFPTYLSVQRRILDREAGTHLTLIQAAEKSYRIEERAYVDTANTTNTNELLGLDLSPTGHWSYSVPTGFVNNASNPPTFCAEATSGGEAWHIDQDDHEAADCDCALTAATCTGR
ncbi:MAG: type II secretion system GspH family protein [Candidatus Omnitrophica bacterium]|nr:type II secretion system GspH family protein [Candidatus Omnitrophota bacterium]